MQIHLFVLHLETLLQLIKSARYSRVLSKIQLKKIQRTLIGSFKNYIINANKPYRVDNLISVAGQKPELDFSNFDP